jgi:hypothetical protein
MLLLLILLPISIGTMNLLSWLIHTASTSSSTLITIILIWNIYAFIFTILLLWGLRRWRWLSLLNWMSGVIGRLFSNFRFDHSYRIPTFSMHPCSLINLVYGTRSTFHSHHRRASHYYILVITRYWGSHRWEILTILDHHRRRSVIFKATCIRVWEI